MSLVILTQLREFHSDSTKWTTEYRNGPEYCLITALIKITSNGYWGSVWEPLLKTVPDPSSTVLSNYSRIDHAELIAWYDRAIAWIQK